MKNLNPLSIAVASLLLVSLTACDRPETSDDSSQAQPAPPIAQEAESTPQQEAPTKPEKAPNPVPTPQESEDGLSLPPLAPDQKPTQTTAIDITSLSMDPVTERFSDPATGKPYNGFGYTTMVGGKLASEGLLVNGFYEGEWVEYHENGKLAAKGAFKNGMEEGGWVFYTDDGAIDYEASFKEGTPDGQWIIFNDEGKLDSKGKFKDGLMDGVWEYFDPQTGAATQITYRDGVKVSQ